MSLLYLKIINYFDLKSNLKYNISLKDINIQIYEF